MKKLLCLSLFLLIPFVANAEALKNTRSEKNLSKLEAVRELPVYETGFLDTPFIVLGKVNVKSSVLKELSAKLKRAAYRNGGDAVLNYKIQNTGSVSAWTGAQVSYAEGVVVKFSENGIKKITDATPVPVLE